MDARKGNIYEILNGNKQFLIPVYQRYYSWDIEQCKRLWNDIVEMHSLTYSTVPKMSLPIYHFFFDKKEIFLNTMHTMEQNKQDFSGKILFDPAVVLNAQNSKNRSGYGNEYYRDELIYEGTLYGETTEYVITGFDLVKI